MVVDGAHEIWPLQPPCLIAVVILCVLPLDMSCVFINLESLECSGLYYGFWGVVNVVSFRVKKGVGVDLY